MKINEAAVLAGPPPSLAIGAGSRPLHDPILQAQWCMVAKEYLVLF